MTSANPNGGLGDESNPVDLGSSDVGNRRGDKDGDCRNTSRSPSKFFPSHHVPGTHHTQCTCKRCQSGAIGQHSTPNQKILYDPRDNRRPRVTTNWDAEDWVTPHSSPVWPCPSDHHDEGYPNPGLGIGRQQSQRQGSQTSQGAPAANPGDRYSNPKQRSDLNPKTINGISKVKFSRPRKETKRMSDEKERNRRALDKVVNECSLEELSHPALVGTFDMAKITCFNCQQRGHMKKQCPKKLKSGLKVPKLSAPVIQAVFESSPAQVRAKKKRGNWNHKGERVYQKNEKGGVYNIGISSGDEDDDEDQETSDDVMGINELGEYGAEADPAPDTEDSGDESSNALELMYSNVNALGLGDAWTTSTEPKEVSFASYRMGSPSKTLHPPSCLWTDGKAPWRLTLDLT